MKVSWYFIYGIFKIQNLVYRILYILLAAGGKDTVSVGARLENVALFTLTAWAAK